MAKLVILAIFWKAEACGQTVLPDRSILIGQKLVENAKIENIFVDFSKFLKFNQVQIEAFRQLMSLIAHAIHGQFGLIFN